MKHDHTGRCLTVGDIRQAIEDLPDDMPVGRSGHFGEFNHSCRHDFVGVQEANAVKLGEGWRCGATGERVKFFTVEIPVLGEEPE